MTNSELVTEFETACREYNRYNFFRKLKLSDRTNRLLAVGYCRLLKVEEDTEWLYILQKTEDFAEGAAIKEEMNTVREVAYNKWYKHASDENWVAVAVAAAAAAAAPAVGPAVAAEAVAVAAAAKIVNQRPLSALLVNVVDCDLVVSPTWRTATVIALANHIYSNKDWFQMPILADALEEADCNNSDLLERLRNPESVWCIGCRILDDLLEKTR